MRATFIMVAAMLLALAACETGTHIVEPEDPVEKAAREFWDHVGKTVAEQYGTTPEERRRGIYSKDPGIQAAVVAQLAESRAKQFEGLWNRYLSAAGGQYAVLAVDRNMRGAGGAYCTGGGCHNIHLPQVRSAVEYEFKGGALNLCRQHVRQQFPAEKPDCAIYAIKDKIVWEGPKPWE